MDVWVTQVGSGTVPQLDPGGARRKLVNPSVRTLGFSPDSSLVTFWVRRQGGSSGRLTSASGRCQPLGGQPRPYLEGVAEFGTGRTTAPGSRTTRLDPETRCSCQTANCDRRESPSSLHLLGSHCHFPLWASDAAFIYFVQGSPTQINWTSGASPRRRRISWNGSRQHAVGA